MPEEPSILDYLKSRLKFWERGEKIKLPTQAEPPEQRSIVAPQEVEVEPTVLEPLEAPAVELPEQKKSKTTRWPWRSLLALALALLAQRTWDLTSDRKVVPGLVLYALSLGLLIWAYLSQEWLLPSLPETGSGMDTLKVRQLPLFLGIPLATLAFIMLGNNLFTIWNFTLWVLAIACFVWAFWLPSENTNPFWERIRAFFARDTWQIKVTRWTLLILAVGGIVAFYRIYNLGSVPSQPVSDHAEKILDVYDVSQGQTHIFFPRNTGREAIQMYLTLVVSWIFGTGLSYLSLKIGTVICGLVTLPYLYLLGKEFGGKRIGLLAMFFAGIAYWPNVISRVGLRFPLYPLFAAPTLYYLLRGLRRRNRNDFILSGLFLGFGLHGYTPMRIVPFVVMAAIGIYLLHSQSKGNRKQALIWLVILGVISFIVFLPLARYWLDNPSMFSYRALTRMGTVERPYPGPVLQIFLMNIWNALRMLNWNDGDTWVHSVVFRPALDVVSGALFILGTVLVLIRYIRQRHWQDLFLLLSIPLLELPSSLSLAFPNENPDLTRTGAALIPVFLIVAMALDGLLTAILSRMNRRVGIALACVVILFLASWSSFQNYDLVFHQYADQYTASANDTSDMGAVISQFRQVYGTTDSIWIVAYPYWVDTRLPGVWVGIPNRDFALWTKDFNTTLTVKGPKLFMIKPDDTQDVDLLKQLYPQAVISTFHSTTKLQDKNFLILFVPSNG